MMKWVSTAGVGMNPWILSGLLLALGCILFSRSSPAQNLPPEVLSYADQILFNGQVLTMDGDHPPIRTTEALAIREGRIMAVGENERILRMAGPETLQVDLRGRAVLPGIVDTHSHPNSYALTHYPGEVTQLYLRFLEENRIRSVSVRWDSKETVLADLRTFAAKVPAGEMIFSTHGLTKEVRATWQELRKEDLDTAVPDHALFIRIAYGMWALANSPMLERIQDFYGNNLPGVLRDDKGEPTGQMFGAAGEVIDVEMLPAVPPEILAPAFRKELDEWVALGVTTLSTRLKGNEITAYGNLERRGDLPLRIAFSHELGRVNPFLERDLKRIGNLQGHGTDQMWMIGLTVGNPDGTGPNMGEIPGGQVCVSVPKREMFPNDFYPEGMCYWTLPEASGHRNVLAANRYGYRISGLHTYGDRAVSLMMETYEDADREDSIEGKRFALDHGTMVTPEAIRRSARMGILWSLQPPLFYGGNAANISRVYGEEYAHQWVLPVKSMVDAGVHVSYGADTHRDPDRHPMFGLEILVTRKTKDGRIFGPQEKIDRSTALLMMTRWGAEYVLAGERIGSIEPGKLADLVILDRNPLDAAIPDDALSEIRVEATILGGKVIYGGLK